MMSVPTVDRAMAKKIAEENIAKLSNDELKLRLFRNRRSSANSVGFSSTDRITLRSRLRATRHSSLTAGTGQFT